MGYSPGGAFSFNDLDACYPMPPWVAERVRDFPQQSQGNALRDPLPVPFTRDEVREALRDVWRASHQFNDRRCATVSAAAVQIALQVLPILESRNGAWIDFSGRAYNPLVSTPGSNIGRGANLRLILVKLAGKKLLHASGWDATSPHPSRTYNILEVATTFDGSEVSDAADLPSIAHRTGPPFRGQSHRPLIGSDFETESLAPAEPPGLPLFELIASFGPHD